MKKKPRKNIKKPRIASEKARILEKKARMVSKKARMAPKKSRIQEEDRSRPIKHHPKAEQITKKLLEKHLRPEKSPKIP